MIGIMGSAYAQNKNPNEWNSTLGVYLWATGIKGTTQIGPVTAPIDITFSDALDNLSSVLTLHYEAQKNQWGLMADVMHIGLDPSAALPGDASLNIRACQQHRGPRGHLPALRVREFPIPVRPALY